MATHTVVCQRCRAGFVAGHPRAKYCPDCKPQMTGYVPTRYPGIRKRIADDGTVSYAVQVRIRGYPPVNETVSTLTRAKERREEIRRELREGRHRAQTGERTFSELVERYQRSTAWTDLDPQTRRNRDARLKWWKEKLGSGTYLRNITPERIAQLRDDLGAGGTPSGKPASKGTTNRYLAALSAVFGWATDELPSWATYNPVRAIRRPKQRAADRAEHWHVLTDAEWERLKPHLDKADPRLRLMVLCSLSSSVRRGELLRWRWTTTRLNESVGKIRSPRKSGTPRIAYVSGIALEALKEAANTPHVSGLVFAARDGSAYFPRKRWDKLREDAELEHLRWHDLRHTSITWLASLGASDRELQELSGHVSGSQLDTYVHLGQAMRSDTAPLFVQRLLRVA